MVRRITALSILALLACAIVAHAEVPGLDNREINRTPARPRSWRSALDAGLAAAFGGTTLIGGSFLLKLLLEESQLRHQRRRVAS